MARIIFQDDFNRGTFNDDMAPGPAGQPQYMEDEISGGGESDWRLEGTQCWPDGPPILIGGGPSTYAARQVVVFSGAGISTFLTQSATDPARIQEWETSCDITWPQIAIPNNIAADLVVMGTLAGFERVVLRWRHYVLSSPVEILELRYHTAAFPLQGGFSAGSVSSAQGLPAIAAGATNTLKCRMRVHNGGQTCGFKMFVDGIQLGPELFINIGTLTSLLQFPGNYQAAPKNPGFAAQLEGGNMTGQPAFPPAARVYFDNLQVVDLINPLEVDDPFPEPTLQEAASPGTKITVATELDDAGTLPIQPSYARPMEQAFRRSDLRYNSAHQVVFPMQGLARRRWVKTFGPMDSSDASTLRTFVDTTTKGMGKTYTWVDPHTDETRKMRIDGKTVTITPVGRGSGGRIFMAAWEALELINA